MDAIFDAIDRAVAWVVAVFGLPSGSGFHFAGDFLDRFSSVYTLYISGEKGSGKTLLAFALAKHLLDTNSAKGIWTNIPSRLPFRFEMTDTIFLLDEGAEFADARDSKDEDQGYHKYLRKLNSYLILPSVDAPDKRLRGLEAYRIFALAGFDWWVYGWRSINGGSRGWFVLSSPENYFHLYDTKAIPEDDNGMAEALNSIRPIKTKVRRTLRIVENAKSRSQAAG